MSVSASFASKLDVFDTPIARRRILAYTLGGGIFLIAIILLATAWVITQGRSNAHRAAEVATTNLSNILATNISSTVDKMDLGLLDVLDELNRQQKLGIWDEQQIIDLIARQDARNPNSAGFRVYDRTGRLRFGVSNVVSPDADISQLTPFKYLRDNPAAGLFVSPPIFGAVLRQWIVSASRRVTNPEGSFGGVVASGISTCSLVKAFSALNLGAGGIIALYHSNNQLAARFPETPGSESALGKVVINDNLRSMIAAGIEEAQIDYTSAVDGARRTGHAQKISKLPYYIVVSFAENDYLAKWRSEARNLLVLVGLAVVLILLGMGLGYRSQIRRLQLVVDLAELNCKLVALSATDGLTGIGNRRRFDEVLVEEWRRGTRNRQSLAIAMLDVDFFKKFNDRYGHQAGDDCLRRVAQVLKEHVHRAGDFVARYGGEEFVFLGAATDGENAKRLVDAIRMSLQDLQLPHDASPLGQVTVSIGVAALVPSEVESPTILISKG